MKNINRVEACLASTADSSRRRGPTHRGICSSGSYAARLFRCWPHPDKKHTLRGVTAQDRSSIDDIRNRLLRLRSKIATTMLKTSANVWEQLYKDQNQLIGGRMNIINRHLDFNDADAAIPGFLQ